MKRALLASTLLTVACTSADGLNLGQRHYLTDDARFALEEAAKVNATALLVGLLFGEGTILPGAEGNVARVVSRASAMLEGCAGASVSGSGYDVEIVADCELNGVRWKLDEQVSLLRTEFSPAEVSFLPVHDSIGGVELLLGADVHFPGGLPRMSVSTRSFDWRTLEYDGLVAVDSALTGATLTGTGRWLEFNSEESVLPVTFDAFTVSAATCAPSSGQLSIGPRDVLIAPGETVEITQQILPGGAPQDATIAFGSTVERVTAACPSEPF